MLATYGLLFAAFVALYAPHIPVGEGRGLPLWQLLFSGAVVGGILADLLDWPAVVALALLWFAAAAYRHDDDSVRNTALKIVGVLIGVALALHVVPGFDAFVVAREIQITPESAAMTLKANFDKGAAGLLFLAYYSRRPSITEWPTIVGTGAVYGVATGVLAIGLVLAAGAVRLDPKWSAVAIWWMPINLFLTCVFEEMLFRALVQNSLARALRDRPRWRWFPLAAASVLFGLAHAGGGVLLIAVASVAGIGYGLAYARTGRVESAVLAHFVLNAVHFFAFTYPYAVR